MAEPVRARRLTDQEGQQLQRIVRRGSTNTVRYRRAMMLLASAGGNRVPVIAQLVQADEDTVRDVIHRFNEMGLACLDPRSPASSGKLKALQREPAGRMLRSAGVDPRVPHRLTERCPGSWASPSRGDAARPDPGAGRGPGRSRPRG
ncbi:helix-turn-helix domain-containing protein [Kitasatospora sp. NPDC050467]|uniref:helix-turn-helix domain-containing protein n=1 Tax=Kitasatospora sp. NPDC050467 TaxID=3364053 RepID=UPI0037BD3836